MISSKWFFVLLFSLENDFILMIFSFAIFFRENGPKANTKHMGKRVLIKLFKSIITYKRNILLHYFCWFLLFSSRYHTLEEALMDKLEYSVAHQLKIFTQKCHVILYRFGEIWRNVSMIICWCEYCVCYPIPSTTDF